MYSKHVQDDGIPQNRRLPQEVKRTRNRCTSINFAVEKNEIKRFVEDNKYGHHPDEYEKSGTDPSLLVIFNQKKFDDHDVRLGTDRDVNELILTFGRLGHNIEQEFIFNDLSVDKIVATVQDLAQRDFSNRNSLIVIVLSHGNKNDVIHAPGGTILTHQIWEPFYNSKCLSFKDKPKFFIFGTCKGGRYSQVDKMDIDVVSESTFSTSLEADMIIAYAAVEGSVSNRHIYNGTWLIQELCRNLNSHGRRDDVLSILIRTTKCIAYNYYYVTEDKILIKQMPLFISTLTKKFYLSRSKNRSLLLQMIERQEEIIKSLENINTHNKKKK